MRWHRRPSDVDSTAKPYMVTTDRFSGEEEFRLAGRRKPRTGETVNWWTDSEYAEYLAALEVRNAEAWRNVEEGHAARREEWNRREEARVEGMKIRSERVNAIDEELSAEREKASQLGHKMIRLKFSDAEAYESARADRATAKANVSRLEADLGEASRTPVRMMAFISTGSPDEDDEINRAFQDTDDCENGL